MLALPETIPMVGFSVLLATPIAIVALSLLVYGPRRPLPGWLLARRIPRRSLERALVRGLPWIRRLERVTHPRWPAVAARGRLFAVVVLIAAVILAVPLPGANWLAAVATVLTGIGLLQRDGIVLLGATIALALSLTVALLMVTGAVALVAGLAG